VGSPADCNAFDEAALLSFELLGIRELFWSFSAPYFLKG